MCGLSARANAAVGALQAAAGAGADVCRAHEYIRAPDLKENSTNVPLPIITLVKYHFRGL